MNIDNWQKENSTILQTKQNKKSKEFLINYTLYNWQSIMLNSIKTLQLMDNPLVEKKMKEDEKKEEFNFDYTFSFTSYTLVASDDFQFECQIDMQKKNESIYIRPIQPIHYVDFVLFLFYRSLLSVRDCRIFIFFTSLTFYVN